MSTPANDLNITQPGYVVFDGTATFTGRTFQAGTGITLTNASGVGGNTTIASTASLTDLHTARFIVASSTLGTGANFTSIASAIAAAQSTGVNSTVFMQPGTYTENLTLVPGVNLCAYEADAFTPNVTIVGTCTLTTAGTVSISGIRLQTNSAALLAVTGSAASIVNLRDCYLNCTNNTGITFSAASTSARIFIDNCKGDLGTTGIGLFANTSTGAISITNSAFTNTGASVTATTSSAGTLNISYSSIVFPITISSTGVSTYRKSVFDTSAQNTTPSTLNGGTCVAYFCSFGGGSASAISIGSSACFLEHCNIGSTNTNAITGSGTLNYAVLDFSSTSSTINTSSQVPLETGPKIYAKGGISFDSGTDILANFVKETSWTPTLNFGGSTTGITYGTQQGSYSQIGKMVFFSLTLILTSKGAQTGSATITGLPVTSSATSGANYIFAVGNVVLATPASTNTFFGILTPSSTTISLDAYGTASGTNSAVTNTQFGNTSQFSMSGMYLAT